MTLTAPTSSPRTLRTLQELPPRLPVSPPDAGATLRWERCAPERYVVWNGTRVIGYVDVVGAVFVVLAGSHYDRATEVAQTLVFDSALAALTGTDPEC